MSNVINLRSGNINIKKLFCDCGHSLEYWLGDDECGYGICPVCDLDNPVEITLKGEEEWKH
tara:strand:+ start:292 stop:474 length:183 start_codon:yes stop_codon:yes gene_type:complete